MAVGCSALLLFKGFNTGIMNQYRANSIHAFYGHGQVNTRGYLDQAFENPSDHWIADPPSVIRSLLSIAGVREVFPRIGFYALLTNGSMAASGRGMGVDGTAEAGFFTTMNVVQGAMLRDEEDGILLGEGLARSLGLSVDSPVTVMARTVSGAVRSSIFRVTGIFHSGMKDVDDAYFRVQLPRAQRLLDTQKVELISLGLQRDDQWDAVAARITEQAMDLEATPFAVLDKAYYQNSVDWLNAQFGVIQLIILCIVVLGIFNTVSSGILERAPEIVSLRANGESAAGVLLLLLLESLFLGILGAALGTVAGFLISGGVFSRGIFMPPAPGLTRRFWVRFEIQPIHVLVSCGLAVGCALLATALAGARLARMDIGKALRSP